MKRELTTERLQLRQWKEEDARMLYEFAKSPEIGPVAGWPVHTDVENSRQIIRDVLSKEGTYAVVFKEENIPVGSAGLMIGEAGNLALNDEEAEIGYWIGVPYWGRGLIPEAVRELMRYAFEELGLKKLWCIYYDGNEKSWRVQQKCGFTYVRTEVDQDVPLLGEKKTEHITCISKEEWLKSKI